MSNDTIRLSNSIFLHSVGISLCCILTYFHQDFEAIGIDKRGFKLRLEKAAKKLPSLPIETAIPVSCVPLRCDTWTCSYFGELQNALVSLLSHVALLLQDSVKDWLHELEMEEYTELFHAEGYETKEDVENLKDLTTDELEAIGIHKRGTLI